MQQQQAQSTDTHQLLKAAIYLRLCDIIGDKEKGITPIIPIGKTTFLNGVRSGNYPKPVKLSARSVGWKASDIQALVDKLNERAA